jgi:hypothetical protein
MTTLLQDLRFALRQLRKAPGFTITAILTLAFAIGANAVVFSVLNGLILRRLNVPQPQSLYGIERASDMDMSQSYPDYLDLRNRNHSFNGLTAFTISEVALDTGDGPSRVWGEEATGNYFDVLNIRPWLGRFFHDSDEHGPNSAPYMVLGHTFWHTHFHDDRGVVGRVVQLNKHPFTILGVAPPQFQGTLVFVSANFFVPIGARRQGCSSEYSRAGFSPSSSITQRPATLSSWQASLQPCRCWDSWQPGFPRAARCRLTP